MKKTIILLISYCFIFSLSFISCNKKVTGPEENLVSPTLISPANNETITTVTPRLQWFDVDDAKSYEIAVSTSNDFSNPELIYSDILDSCYTTETLSPGRYYWRVKAKNGTWSETWSFNLLTTLTDIDGNIYNLVKIGNQIWSVENLKVTRYRNGDLIPNITNESTWKDQTTGAYCAYENDASIADIYGLLYNSYAVLDSRNVAPVGWHVPTDEDWDILKAYLGGTWMVGFKLMAIGNIEDGTGLWYSPNQGIDWAATNESGFTALPGGYRVSGDYMNADVSLGREAYFWSSTTPNPDTQSFRLLKYYLLDFVEGATSPMITGMSIRLIKD